MMLVSLEDFVAPPPLTQELTRRLSAAGHDVTVQDGGHADVAPDVTVVMVEDAAGLRRVVSLVAAAIPVIAVGGAIPCGSLLRMAAVAGAAMVVRGVNDLPFALDAFRSQSRAVARRAARETAAGSSRAAAPVPAASA